MQTELCQALLDNFDCLATPPIVQKLERLFHPKNFLSSLGTPNVTDEPFGLISDVVNATMSFVIIVGHDFDN